MYIRSKEQILDDYVRKEQFKDFQKHYKIYHSLYEQGFISKEDLDKYIIGEKQFGIYIKNPNQSWEV